MDWLGHIFWVIQLAAIIILIFKADEYDSIISLIFAPITFHRIIFGSGLFILIPIGIVVLTYFVSPVFGVALIIWQILYPMCLGKAYDASWLFILFLIFLPGISMIVLAFSNKHNYQGPVDLLFFLRNR